MNIEELVKINEKLIYKIASKFYNYDQDDLFQVGVIGLIKAYNNYKNNKDTKFSTYAYEYIFGEMYKLVNDSRMIKLNRDILKMYKRIEETKYLLAQKLLYVPSNYEIALYLEISEDIVSNVIESASSILSLDTEIQDEYNLYDSLKYEDNLSLNDKIDLKDSIDILNKDEKIIINYRYFKGLTQQETAKKLGLSQVKVSRYEKKSLNKMYAYLNN